MAERLVALTESQRAQVLPYARQWIAAGLATGPADHAAFTEAARACYTLARLPWPHNVVWVSSPLVLALTVPLAARALRSRQCGFLRFDVYNPLLGVQGDCDSSVIETISRRVYRAVHGAVAEAVEPAVQEELQAHLTQVVEQAVERPLHHAAQLALNQSIARLRETPPAVLRAVQEAVRQASGEQLTDAQLLEALNPDNFAMLHRSFSHFSGQLGAGGVVADAFCREVGGLALPGDTEARARAGEGAIRSACWWYAHPEFVLVCERPSEMHLETLNPGRSPAGAPHRLHRTAGPALVWPDGWGVHALHGLPVPGWIIEHPERITVLDIEQQRNAEVRRAMIESYGWSRFIEHCGAEVVDQVPMDHRIRGLRGARLLRKELPGEPEPIVYLDMVNSTAEPDGSFRHYLERIDPQAYEGAAGRSCHAAMASRWRHRDGQGQLQRTFERWQDYQPQEES